MRLIDADALRAAMYHEAFETDSDLQRWDAGCWIRWRMFEKMLDAAPTIAEDEQQAEIKRLKILVKKKNRKIKKLMEDNYLNGGR